MAKVKYISGIGIGTQSSALYIDMSVASTREAGSFKETIPADIINSAPWSPWGADNLFPQQLTRDIETTGILNAIIDGKARFALCQGMVPAIVHTDTTGQRVIDRIVEDAEIVDFMEMNNHFYQTFGWMKDQVAFGSGVARFMADNSGKKIASFQRDDITETRYKKQDPKTGKISHLYYSASWDKIRSPNDNRVFTVPLLSPNNPVADLKAKVAAGQYEHAMTFRYPGWGKHYYSMPLWMAAYKWIKIAQGVPEMKAALFENSMRPMYMVIIHETFWENKYGDKWPDDQDDQDELKQAFYDEIEQWMVGAKNAYKTLFVNGYTDGDGKTYQDIEIKEIPNTIREGELIPDSAAANSEIAFALLFNPAIIGASLPSGPYTNSQGGSSVRESVLMQIILHEFERQNVRRVMNVIKYFNGWNERYKGLEFIIPATVLTTLDTGGSSKPIITGNVNPKEPENKKEAA